MHACMSAQDERASLEGPVGRGLEEEAGGGGGALAAAQQPPVPVAPPVLPQRLQPHLRGPRSIGICCEQRRS